jgi:hypothetical protein
MTIRHRFDNSNRQIEFPYQSLLNLRHWRKALKSFKPFFQVLTCLFSMELKVNHQLIHTLEFYRPLPVVMRMKYSNLREISSEYIRTKSFDAYMIA